MQNQLVVVHDAFQHLVLSINASPDSPMAMVTVYFDDSGTHQQSDIAVAACFVSDVRRWDRFQEEWLPIIQQAGVEDFHMAKFVARAKPYDIWTQEKRDFVYQSLIGVINKYAYQGIVAAVIKADYDKLVTGKLRDKLGHHHFTFAVQSCLAHIEYWRKTSTDEQSMEYVFDLMSYGKHEIIDLFDDIAGRKTATSFGIEPRGYAFQNRRQVVQLQSSDILAWEAFRYMKDCQFTGKPPRKSFQSIVNNVPIWARFFNSFHLSVMVEDLTRKYERLNWEGPLGGFLEPETILQHAPNQLFGMRSLWSASSHRTAIYRGTGGNR